MQKSFKLCEIKNKQKYIEKRDRIYIFRLKLMEEKTNIPLK